MLKFSPRPKSKIARQRIRPMPTDWQKSVDIAKHFQVSQATVYRWTQLKDDPLPSQKVIGVRRISLSVADEWFSRREEGNL